MSAELTEHSTWTDLAKAIGAEFGLTLTDAEADFVLWEHTGFPGFFVGDPFECCVRQLTEFFASRPRRLVDGRPEWVPSCGNPPIEAGQ